MSTVLLSILVIKVWMETINKSIRILQNRFVLSIYLLKNQSIGPLHATAFFSVLAV